MPGILYVVATPIGNLEDVTLRALRVLREVSIIAAEDTRRTARLLQHYSISTPTTSLHQHNEAGRTPGLIARLDRGESVALVSDAGTPAVSDPGTLFVAAAHAAGIRVEPVPGPSAAMAAVSASGLHGPAIVFLGFPPSRSNARSEWLRALTDDPRLLVLYEAPHRVVATLEAILEILGDRVAAVGRELTKVHEDLVVRPISVHLASMATPRGEYTIVISPPLHTRSSEDALPDDESLLREFGQIAESGAVSRRDAVRHLARKYHIPSGEMYRMLERGRSRSV